MTQTSNTDQQDKGTLVISYKGLLKSIGVAGIAMPVIMAFGVFIFSDCGEIQRSISAYYHTVMRDVFTAIIACFSFFLYTYKGYKSIDHTMSKIASVCALGIVLFPTKYREVADCSYIPHYSFDFSQTLHLIFAICFFLVLTFISYFLFTKTHEGKEHEMTKQKKIRNKIYKTCGIIMFACILGVLVYWICESKGIGNFEKYKPIFWFESLALVAFGVSWLVKGEVILKDK